MTLGRAWTPYVMVAGLLVLTRLPFLPFKAWLSSVEFGWYDVLGTADGYVVQACRSEADGR